ncbi:DUF6357 family protein [Streptomyces sp. NPDC058330]|uniref:DUF6357 family protein n=1 Tax=Streptomyces sp. NPDC058330 TaxID=3346449 RepID=UPI0036EFF45B
MSAFVRGGCAALEQHGPWTSDTAEFERAPTARRRVVRRSLLSPLALTACPHRCCPPLGPERFRLRPFTTAARPVNTGRRHRLRLLHLPCRDPGPAGQAEPRSGGPTTVSRSTTKSSVEPAGINGEGDCLP